MPALFRGIGGNGLCAPIAFDVHLRQGQAVYFAQVAPDPLGPLPGKLEVCLLLARVVAVALQDEGGVRERADKAGRVAEALVHVGRKVGLSLRKVHGFQDHELRFQVEPALQGGGRGWIDFFHQVDQEHVGGVAPHLFDADEAGQVFAMEYLEDTARLYSLAGAEVHQIASPTHSSLYAHRARRQVDANDPVLGGREDDGLFFFLGRGLRKQQ